MGTSAGREKGQAQAAGARHVRLAREAERGGYTGHPADPEGSSWEVVENLGFAIADHESIRLPG